VEHLTHRLHVRVVAPQDFVPAGEHRVGHVLQAVHREGAVVQELELGPGAAQRGWNSKRDKNPTLKNPKVQESGSAAPSARCARTLHSGYATFL
jgi:hypothetical protein